MRITQGTFSFLPDLTDEQIEAQIRYALENEWAIMVEHTDDPHPRNAFWDMFDQPHFDLDADEADQALDLVKEAREAFPQRYIKVQCYDRSLGRQSSRLSFIVNRPEHEPGFRLERQYKHDRTVQYTLHPYSADEPAGRRYGETHDLVAGVPGGYGERKKPDLSGDDDGSDNGATEDDGDSEVA